MKPARCPTPESLSAYVLGKLSDEEMQPVAEHAAGCKKCQSTLTAADCQSDPLLGHVRAARGADNAAPEPALSRLLQRAEALSGDSLTEETIATQPAEDGGFQEARAFLAPPQAADELGRLGPYRVLQELGAGGMGLVYRAEDTQLRRPIALKVMRPSSARDDEARQRFLHEARATAAVSHERIITIYQVGEQGDVPFLAMQLLQGEPLEARLGRADKSPLSVAEVLRIGRDVADGLAAAHAKGLIHRDIKPANIWLEADSGRAKVLDFGLARSSFQDVRLTQTGCVLGTPAYMSPEQAHSRPVGPASDLFSLGVVLYRMLTGIEVFRRGSSYATLIAVVQEEPTSVRVLNPQVPEAAADLVHKLLAKKIEDRPATAAEVSKALGALVLQVRRRTALPAQQQPAASGTARIVAPPPARRRKRSMSLRLALPLAVALLAAAVVGGSKSLVRHLEVASPPPTPPETSTMQATQPALSGEKEFLEDVAQRGPHKQFQVVAGRLIALNPGLKFGDLSHTLDPTKSYVRMINVPTDLVTDLSPLRALPKLEVLYCSGSSPGKGKLTTLSALRGLKLTYLDCKNNQIRDLSLLRDMPLRFVHCDYQPERDAPVLRGILSLVRINGEPAKDVLARPAKPGKP
jgi:serine/threonine protein kinase